MMMSHGPVDSKVRAGQANVKRKVAAYIFRTKALFMVRKDRLTFRESYKK